ncbi:putative oligopeptide transporter [Lyophyllum shimeji]|uniref:Oligopeptide transporter n=1 Tax=Lyophyllum shimeji TaxID=47721 RepID=A0A9P3UQP4_LYOSH|nr:putative oligopeptide transporter [Lyophyllum shimeji]
MSIQSALIGFLVSKMLPVPMTPQEIIVVQTTAVATGTMPLAAGFVGILPALSLLDEDRDGSPPIRLSWLSAVAWSCGVAFFGVFLSPPIRKQVIIEEQLTFPSGTATAQLISVLHKLPLPDTVVRRRGYTHLDPEDDVNYDEASEGPTAADEESDDEHDEEERESVEHDGWRSLSWSFGASGLLALFAYFFPVTFTIPVFGSYLAREWLWYFTPSLSYVGQGIIMGFPTTLSMNLGMFVGWAILSPLAKFSGWAPGPVGDMSTGARGWILWTSLGIMCADSFVSLLPVALDYIVDLVTKRGNHNSAAETRSKDTGETETEDRLVPTSWVLVGLVSSIAAGTILVWAVFGHAGIKPWATVLGFLLGGMLSIFGVRALGETDLNPVSGLGKISQLLFAWIQPGNIVANIIAGGVTEAGAQQAGDLMQDLKTGHLLHASPRAQFYGQLIGSSVSILVTATAFTLYNRAYIIPGPSFPAPTAYVWLSLARLLRDGQLPENSPSSMIVFSLLFGTLSTIRTISGRTHHWITKWIPSGVAFAIGFLNTPSFSIARLIGGTLEYVYRTRYAKDKSDIGIIIVASGFVLGEGVLYSPEVVRCVSLPGGHGTDVDWKCEADLPEALRFGRVEVSCEGWSRPGDPYVLKGSCSLEYRLVQVPGVLRNTNESPILSKLQAYDLSTIIFSLIWVAFLVFILYNFFLSCFRRNGTAGQTLRRPSPPRLGNSGGWFPGGMDDSQNYQPPPPPYSKTPPDGSQGWRPGFWTGAVLGGALNHLYNRVRAQPQPQPEPRARPTVWDWERPQPRSSMFGGRPVTTSAQYDDRGEGSSNLGSLRRSTGYGGSNVR